MRGEVIYLKVSQEFAAVVGDIIGRRGLREAAIIAGISAGYMGSMKNGTIPSADVLAKFAAGFQLSGELAKRFWDAAKTAQPEINAETVIRFACDAQGLDTMAQWRVIEAFRQELNQPKSNQAA